MFFVGMMGTGKSTIARGLADVMGRYIFLDTDSIIEELLGASVGEVFETDGEEAFRSVESQVLDQVCRTTRNRAEKCRGGVVVERAHLFSCLGCLPNSLRVHPFSFEKEKSEGLQGRVYFCVFVLLLDAGHR